MANQGFLYTNWSYFYYEVFGGNDFAFFAIGTLILTTSVYWSVSIIFCYMDLTGKPQWIVKYKVQPGTNQPVDPDKLRHAISVTFINQVFVGVPMLCLFYLLARKMGTKADPESLPTVLLFFRDYVACFLISEVLFYYIHRIFHWGPMYRRFHKIHHEWMSPIGVTAFYCHPLEHATSNTTLMAAGVTLMGSHVLTTWIWYTLLIVFNITAHSNYHLPFAPIPPEYHDFHHSKIVSNYGTELGLMDWLHGTDGNFRESIQSKRNKVLFGLTPISELVTNETKKAS